MDVSMLLGGGSCVVHKKFIVNETEHHTQILYCYAAMQLCHMFLLLSMLAAADCDW